MEEAQIKNKEVGNIPFKKGKLRWQGERGT